MSDEGFHTYKCGTYLIIFLRNTCKCEIYNFYKWCADEIKEATKLDYTLFGYPIKRKFQSHDNKEV